jgi:hypothetical protein
MIMFCQPIRWTWIEKSWSWCQIMTSWLIDRHVNWEYSCVFINSMYDRLLILPNALTEISGKKGRLETKSQGDT